MKTIVEILLYPMTWFVIGFFILWILRKRASRLAQRLWILGMIIIAYSTSTFYFPDLLNTYLEDQYPPLNVSLLDTTRTYNIISLGGGMGYDDRLPANSLLEQVTLMRLVEGIRVHKALPGSRLITSGYSSVGRKPQAEVAREAAILIGVDDTSVFAQGKPSNTQEEANEYVATWGKEAPVIIATSAIHMPRAIYLFKSAGIKEVLAAPTHFRVKKQNPKSIYSFFKPRFLYWGEISSCLHEIVGLWYAKWVNASNP
jgi:uncharacterized SAM-binding protein YcdF (DUF218 family)